MTPKPTKPSKERVKKLATIVGLIIFGLACFMGGWTYFIKENIALKVRAEYHEKWHQWWYEYALSVEDDLARCL